MSIYDTQIYRWWHKLTSFISDIHWTKIYARFNGGRAYGLTPEDHQLIKEKLASSYYIILIHRKTHLTTYLIGVLAFLKTGKWPKYSHALMNADAYETVSDWDKFKLVEATSIGVHISRFGEVFDCDSVCLLRPRNMKKDDWNAVIEGLLSQNGYQYDDLFDLADKSRVSCVELVLNALKNDPNYTQNFPHLEEMIKNVGNLTPQMFRDCPDFQVSLEIKR